MVWTQERVMSSAATTTEPRDLEDWQIRGVVGL